MINLNISDEEKAALLLKAREAREAKKAAFIANSHLLKSDFADKPYWRKLASSFGVRFPADYVPGSEVKLARRAMKKCGVSPDDVRQSLGMDIKAFAELNSTCPSFAIVGVILEIGEELARQCSPNLGQAVAVNL